MPGQPTACIPVQPTTSVQALAVREAWQHPIGPTRTPSDLPPAVEEGGGREARGGSETAEEDYDDDDDDDDDDDEDEDVAMPARWPIVAWAEPPSELLPPLFPLYLPSRLLTPPSWAQDRVWALRDPAEKGDRG
ncbi:hypothetical protein KM043_011587 [Ampulex compressa]|nr:hypothetical protein KM043_011587 [Ampulex compressa]